MNIDDKVAGFIVLEVDWLVGIIVSGIVSADLHLSMQLKEFL